MGILGLPEMNRKHPNLGLGQTRFLLVGGPSIRVNEVFTRMQLLRRPSIQVNEVFT
jgi:hypothetical protein